MVVGLTKDAGEEANAYTLGFSFMFMYMVVI